MADLINDLGGQAGFGEFELFLNDDGSSQAIDIRSVFGEEGLNFFGTFYTHLFINNNGNITFNAPLSQFTPSPLGTGLSFPIIAPLWYDIDTRQNQGVLSEGGTSTGRNRVFWDLDTERKIFTVTWDDVGFFSHNSNPPAAFQLRLFDVGTDGNFGFEFRYEFVSAYGSYAPRAGYSSGNQEGFQQVNFELPGSGNQAAVANFDTTPGNTGQIGIWQFNVTGGQVEEGPTQPPEEPETEEGPPPEQRFSIGPSQPTMEGDVGGRALTFLITRSGDISGQASASWELVLEDADEEDLVPGQALGGVVSFGPTQTRATVTVFIQGDRMFEPDEAIGMRITGSSAGNRSFDPMGVGTVFILNDDPPAMFRFTGPQTRPEGAVDSSFLEFVVLRTGDLRFTSTVQWALDFGQADAEDFAPGQALTGTLTYAAGQDQATIRVLVQGDTRAEPNETFTVRLTSATTNNITRAQDASTTGTILDDDARQTLILASPSSMTLLEGTGEGASFNFTIVRLGATTDQVSVPYTTSFNGASPADLQGPLSGTVTFEEGSSFATLTVNVNGDTVAEGAEAFVVTLGGGDFTGVQVTGIIMNDDFGAPSAGGSAPDASAVDGDKSGFIELLMGGSLWSGLPAF